MADPQRSIPVSVAERLRQEIGMLGTLSASALLREVEPAAVMLLELRPAERPDAFEYRECLTVLTLVGRRLALLDVTPSSALAVTDILLRVARETGTAITPWFDERAMFAVVEGFVLGREEHVSDQLRTVASESIRPLRLSDDAYLLAATGEHDPEVLREQIDALGRVMLDAGATTALVDATQLARPTPEQASALFSADMVLKVAGARTIFSGIDAFWEDAAVQANVDLDMLTTFGTFRQGLAAARGGAGQERRGLLSRMLGRDG